ncbi:MAG: hypothetical protein O3A92_15370, partial [Verrucomicrobia bacterium]|nr:hypothetical protein [Verrucomicrobiota bacterium]
TLLGTGQIFPCPLPEPDNEVWIPGVVQDGRLCDTLTGDWQPNTILQLEFHIMEPGGSGRRSDRTGGAGGSDRTLRSECAAGSRTVVWMIECSCRGAWRRLGTAPAMISGGLPHRMGGFLTVSRPRGCLRRQAVPAPP